MGRKLAPFRNILDEILDFRLHKFEGMSILKDCAFLRKSTLEKSLESISLR